MKRTIIQSILFACLLIVVFYSVRIAWGYYSARDTVPDTIDNYTSVEYLQQHVGLGVIFSPLDVIMEIFMLLAIGMIIFIAGKFIIKKSKG